MAQPTKEQPSGPAATADRQPAPTLDETAAPARSDGEPVVTVRATRIGRFTLLHQLGEGGMGAVFAAYDQQLDRRVALKLLHQRHTDSPVQRRRTLQEARAAARISHPNVTALYEVGESDNYVYLAMEYVDGETLSAWQARGGHTWREILELYLHAGAGLAAAHAVGVVHRDFKPDNVLYGRDGRLRVADFGIARIDWARDQTMPPENAAGLAAEAGPGGPGLVSRLTVPGIISGTPGYMSPEQYRGGNVDSRSDQWSFCAALFEALYGYLPFAGDTLRERAEKVHGPPLPPPRATKVPEEVHRILLRGLATVPDQRFATMQDLLDELSLQQGDHAAGRKLSRKHFLSWFVGVGIVALLVLQLRQSQRRLNPRDMISTVGMVLGASLVAGIYYRKTLLGNRFHRALWFLCMANMVENMLQRFIALRLGMPMTWLFPFEMIVLAANSAVIARFFIHWLFWLPSVPLVAATLSVLGLVSLPILTNVYLFMVVIIAIGWSRAARQARQVVITGDAGLGGRAVRSPR
jgi:serine/threonine-protein kinase